MLLLLFTLINFTPSVACGDSSLKREPWQDSELHFAASERDQYFVRLCDFKFYAKVMVFAGIKQASLTEGEGPRSGGRSFLLNSGGVGADSELHTPTVT